MRALCKGSQIKVTLCDSGRPGDRRGAQKPTDQPDGFSGSSNDVDLSICYNIVQHHKGAMQFEVSEEMGDILTIYFPMAEKSNSTG